jgi:ABC-type lipoprotein release transport system permease subunit
LAGVAGSGRSIAALLFGVSPTDPFMLFAVALMLLAVSLAATLVPTLKASRISPMIAISLE